MSEKFTNDEKQELLSKTAYALPDNPSSKQFSANQIKHKLYDGIVYLFDLTKDAIEDVEETAENTYLPLDGSKQMQGNLSMGNHWISLHDSNNSGYALVSPNAVSVTDGTKYISVHPDKINYFGYSLSFQNKTGTLALTQDEVGDASISVSSGYLSLDIKAKDYTTLATATLELASAQEVEALLQGGN